MATLFFALIHIMYQFTNNDCKGICDFCKVKVVKVKVSFIFNPCGSLTSAFVHSEP